AGAMRLRRSRRPASAQGLRPAIAGPVSSSSANPVCASGATVMLAALLHGGLVDQEVPLRVELVPLHALREQVDELRVEERYPDGIVDDLLVDLRPNLVRLGLVGEAELERLVDLRLGRLVAVLRDVRARVAVRDVRAAAQEHAQEVRRRWVVLIPAREAELKLVLRVLGEGGLDVGRQGLELSLVGELV